ncbi:ankyrin repeat domain-containing protein [Montanilutibacter psychrotolerans]|uniref:Ankyrin repeat domain-containing protein n=1 Tax=Montanilutibacter psychrotolerans TaxID=1327343 RepID=A0A3M8SR28_9GAMM|nr:ankyrin repeat domain-containing protein [Lysobacter psychrotolerans]
MNSSYDSVETVLEAVRGAVEFGSFEHRPTVHSVGAFSSRPLKIAITWGDLSAVNLLLGAGASMDAKNEGGDTALHHAIRMGEFVIARRLVKLGAYQSIANDEGKLARDLCWDNEWDSLGLSST